MCRTALNCFQNHLSNRTEVTQFLSRTRQKDNSFSVPQETVLGPDLFIVYNKFTSNNTSFLFTGICSKKSHCNKLTFLVSLVKIQCFIPYFRRLIKYF